MRCQGHFVLILVQCCARITRLTQLLAQPRPSSHDRHNTGYKRDSEAALCSFSSTRGKSVDEHPQVRLLARTKGKWEDGLLGKLCANPRWTIIEEIESLVLCIHHRIPRKRGNGHHEWAYRIEGLQWRQTEAGG